MKKTGGILLAAGLSSRMQDFKPLLPYGEETIARHMVALMKEAGLDPVVVVTGFKAQLLEAHLADAGVRFLKNERFRETDMFASAKLGLQALKQECERMMILPVDLPGIRADTIRRTLLEEAPLIRTRCNGKPGHPIVIASEAVGAICRYQGDCGLKGAMEESGISITELEVEDAGVYFDADTREEYQQLISWRNGQPQLAPIRPQVQVRLAASETFFGPGVCQLLCLVDRLGSIQQACSQINLSYSKGSRMIKNAEQQTGFALVQRWSGGLGGGGSSLTEKGRRFVESYRRLELEVQKNATKMYQQYFEKESN